MGNPLPARYPAGTGTGKKFYPLPMLGRAWVCSTRPEPAPLPSLHGRRWSDGGETWCGARTCSLRPSTLCHSPALCRCWCPPPRRQSLSTRTLPLPLRRGARHKDGGAGEPPTAAGARRRRGLRQHSSSLVGHNLLGNLCKGLVASLCSHTLVVWYGS
jgi:hypothetical protein